LTASPGHELGSRELAFGLRGFQSGFAGERNLWSARSKPLVLKLADEDERQ
jgi:hypothetical protein